MSLSKTDLYTVSIERLSHKGAGIADLDGRPLSIPGALPGDVVEARLVAVKRHCLRGRIERVIEPGVPRVAPPCAHFPVCGGCVWQDVPYEAQCRFKASLVSDALGKAEGLDPPGDIELVPAPEPWGYRNKMEFSIDAPPWLEGRVLVGMHEAGSFNRVFDLGWCHIQTARANAVIAATREFIASRGLTAYGLRSHRGLLRFLVIREGVETGDLMAVLVTSGEPFPEAADYAALLRERVPGLTTVLLSVSSSMAGVATGGEYEVLAGPGRILDRIGPHTYAISPDSFFQTNTRQANRLYDTIREFCALTGSERLLDLYCGTGTIGIHCADRAGDVVGIESAPDAVKDARENAAVNGISNIAFIAGPVEEVIGGLDSFDVAVCDPPRAGIHPDGLAHLARIRIPRLVYVSCNVRQLPLDLEVLALAGYRITAVRAFDMSPHTPHVETVVRLDLA